MKALSCSDDLISKFAKFRPSVVGVVSIGDCTSRTFLKGKAIVILGVFGSFSFDTLFLSVTRPSQYTEYKFYGFEEDA